MIIIGLALFILIAIFRRDLALYLIILLLPTYQIRFTVFGIPVTFLEGMILILAVVELGFKILSFPRRPGSQIWYFRIWVARRESRDWIPSLWKWGSGRGMTFVFILLFLLAALISVFTAPNLAKAAGIFKAYFFEAVLFYFLVLLIIDSQEKTKRLFKTLAILVLYLSLFGIYQFITLYGLPFNWWAVDVESRRIISVLNHPNALALLIGPILGILMFLPGKTKLHWAAILSGLIALYLSFSRAGWLTLLVTILGFGVLFAPSPGLGRVARPPGLPPDFEKTKSCRAGRSGEVGRGERSNRWLKIVIPVILVLLIILVIPFSRTKILDLAKGRDLSQQNRYVLWSAASDILKKSPIFGTGLAGFREAYKNYPLGPDRVIQNYPHNFFLNFWTETGLLGLISIAGLLIIFFRKTYLLLKSPSEQERDIKDSSPLRGEDKGGGETSQSFALAAAAGMTMIVLHGLVDVPYFKNDLSVLFWLVFAIPNLQFYES